ARDAPYRLARPLLGRLAFAAADSVRASIPARIAEVRAAARRRCRGEIHPRQTQAGACRGLQPISRRPAGDRYEDVGTGAAGQALSKVVDCYLDDELFESLLYFRTVRMDSDTDAGARRK